VIRAVVAWWFGVFPLATCSNCRYWQRGAGNSPQEWASGSCRREGPRVLTYTAPAALHRVNPPAQMNVQSYWPPVTPSEWCGRHERRWL
jgi:hypothetical protein